MLCLLDGLPPPSCAGVVLPKPTTRGLTAVRNQLVKATTAPEKRTRRLLKKAAARMGRVSSGLGKASAKGKVPADCASAMRATVDSARGVAQAIVVGP